MAAITKANARAERKVKSPRRVKSHLELERFQEVDTRFGRFLIEFQEMEFSIRKAFNRTRSGRTAVCAGLDHGVSNFVLKFQNKIQLKKMEMREKKQTH